MKKIIIFIIKISLKKFYNETAIYLKFLILFIFFYKKIKNYIQNKNLLIIK